MLVVSIRSAMLIVMLLWAVAAPAAQLDDHPEAASLYDRAEQRLRAGDWLDARLLFDQLLTQFPNSPNRDIYLFSRGKAAYHAGDYNIAQTDFDHLLIEFSASPLAPYAVYFWANAALALGKRDLAMQEYIRATALTTDVRLNRLIADAVATYDGATLRRLVTGDGLSRLSESQRCTLMRDVTGQLLSAGRVDDAAYLQSLCSGQTPVDASAPDSLGTVLKIGVVVPMSGEYQQYGQEVWHGASIAAQQWHSRSGRSVTLSPFDTQSDPVSAGRLITELARLNYDAIIGPLTSNEAAVAAAAVSCYDLPVVVPAATGAGLTLLNKNVFQLAPNIELQGVQMAEYAYRNLRADTAAIITPTNVEYLQIAQAFASRFEALGGTIVGVEYYRSSDRDFSGVIRSIKSLMQPGIDDSAVYLGASGDTLDAKAVPAQIDCLFMPGTPDQLKLLVLQLRFYNLAATYLGNDSWGNDQICSLGDDVCRGAVFASPFLHKGTEQKEFIKEYMAQYGEGPTRLACLGHDAIALLLQGLNQNPPTRQAWISDLARTANFGGTAGKITFGRHRENVELPVYRIEAGRPVLVGLSQSTSTSGGSGQ